jgi:hypothetical protein
VRDLFQYLRLAHSGKFLPGILFLIFGLGLLVYVACLLPATIKCHLANQSVQAVITDRSVKINSDNDESYYLAYRYEVLEEGQAASIYNTWSQVNRPVYEATAVGDTVPVWYLDWDPRSARLEGEVLMIKYWAGLAALAGSLFCLVLSSRLLWPPLSETFGLIVGRFPGQAWLALFWLPFDLLWKGLESVLWPSTPRTSKRLKTRR